MNVICTQFYMDTSMVQDTKKDQETDGNIRAGCVILGLSWMPDVSYRNFFVTRRFVLSIS